jgi:hypothetical protein
MGNLIFKCPNTGLNVQHWLDETEADQDDPSSACETVLCQACNRLHFIKRSSGKLLGQREDQS